MPKNRKDKTEKKKLIDEAAKRLAEIFIMQVKEMREQKRAKKTKKQ